MKSRIAVFVGLVLGVSGVSGVAPAPAGALVFPAAVTLAASDSFAPKIAVGPDGTATGVWIANDGANDRIRASVRPPGGAWGAPVDLSAAGQNAGFPEVTTGLNGVTTAVWFRSDGMHERIQAATRPPGGVWSAADTLSAEGNGASAPQVATAVDGTTTVAWVRFDGTTNRTQAATRPAGGSWSVPVDLSALNVPASDAQIVVALEGTTTVTWTGFESGNDRAQVATRPAGGAWSGPSTLSESGRDAGHVRPAVAPDGTTTLTWLRHDGLTNRVQVVSRAPGGAWGSPSTISDAEQEASRPQVATALDGTATVAWSEDDGALNRIRVSTRPPAGSFSSPTTVSAAVEDTYSPQVAFGPDGTAAVAWVLFGALVREIQVATRAAGGSWVAPATLPDLEQFANDPELAIGLDGTLAVAWPSQDAVRTVVVDDAFAIPPAPLVVPDTSKIKGKKKITTAKAKYTFTSPTPGATFQCRIDKKKWKACSSPYVVKAKKLKNGKHKLFVRAVLGAQVDPTPSVKKFKVKR